MEKVKKISLFKRREIDMTQGSIVKNILLFAFPLLLGNLFQQLYNMVDVWVIGQTGNVEAYSAVGNVGPIINMLIGFFSGLASGAGVIISQYYGAKNEKKANEVAHTSMAMTLALAVVLTVLGIALAPLMLRLMFGDGEDSADILHHARIYLTIYFAGVVGLMVYNMGAGILRAIGDSVRPFWYLVVAAIINIVLDFVFVFPCGMGVAGVALATVIAQLVSAVLTVITLMKTSSCVRLSWRKLKIDIPILKNIFALGFPAALQMMLTALSNVFVQSYVANVNAVKAHCTGGWTTYSKIDQFIFLPVQSISLGVTTLVGQNLGAGDMKRAKKGTYIAFAMSLSVTAVVISIVMIFAPQLAAFFNKDPNVIYYAELLLRNITPFYIMCSVNQVFAAALRGGGNTKAPMFIMLGSFVLFRQIYLFVVSNFISNEILPVAFGYPAGWFVCCVAMLAYYFKVGFSHSRIVAKEE
ncbi:MAG: MATE family efflux transporter [Clostridia bacterium]|nr:MATE family efflux transporter [Clostridia bacterium]